MCNTFYSMDLVICANEYTILIFAILVCGSTVGISQNIVCDDGWTAHGGRCYYFNEAITVGWEQAKSYCNQQKNSYLVSVTDDNINKFLFNNKDNTEHWVGLKPFANAAWGWNDGSPDMDIPWGQGELTGDEACARFTKSKKFYAYGCQKTSPSICERDTAPMLSGTGIWKQYNQHWYLIIGSYLSPQTATNRCMLLGGYLARLTTDDERKFVSNNFEILDGVWVGLTRFVWDDGSGYEWNAWENSYPKYTQCVALGEDDSEQEWKRKGCATQLNFICVQVSPSTTTQTLVTTTMEIETTTETYGTSTPSSTGSSSQSTIIFTTPTTTPTVTQMQSVTLSTTKVTTADSTPVKTRTSSSSSLVQYVTEQSSQTQMSKLLSTQTHDIGKDSTAEYQNPMNEQTSNIVGISENSVNVTAASGLVIRPENKVLWNLLYVIYTLVGTMLVIDVVLLVIYLKLPKPGKTLLRRTPINDEDENQYPEIPVHITGSPTHDNTNCPVYAVPNKRKPRDMDL